MTPFALYCKSYCTDVRRVRRLAESVRVHNFEQIPFYVSVPRKDLPLFREQLAGQPLELLADEDILEASRPGVAEHVARMPGYLAQQVVKSEFWRLNLADTYLCLDSDAFFIRPIRQNEFLANGLNPYTVLDEAHEFQESSLQAKRQRAIRDFREIASKVQTMLDRPGRIYSFGPFPVLWHRAVWQSLDLEYFIPRGMNLCDALTLVPAELHWYGEALLKYRAIALAPCQPLFKVYHYAWEYDRDRRKGITTDELRQIYCGVIYQSAWERELDWPSEGGTLASRLSRRARRLLGRI